MTQTSFLTRCLAGVVLGAATLAVGLPFCSAQGDSGALPTIRMRAGSTTPFKDHEGNAWLPDATTKEGGFDGGETIDRPDDMEIQNTKDPGLYRSEHYSMDSFTYKVPNGKYVVKLHFAETYDGVGGPGDRVFSFKVQDKDFKNFDIWKKAGGAKGLCRERAGRRDRRQSEDHLHGGRAEPVHQRH